MQGNKINVTKKKTGGMFELRSKVTCWVGCPPATAHSLKYSGLSSVCKVLRKIFPLKACMGLQVTDKRPT